MLSSLRNSWISTGLWALLALYFLNISIDAQEPIIFRENLSVNEQESVVEFIAEIVFGYSSAFLELKDLEDETNLQFSKKQLFFFFGFTAFEVQAVPALNPSNQTRLILNQPIFPGHTSIDAPPPQS
jgi:hypothetical protein